MNPEDLDYPLPDPTWDYWSVYHEAISLQREATNLIASMSDVETRSPEADQRIRDSLRQISAHINEISSRLD